MKELPINIQLPDGFLNEEMRCGYTISSEMKAVWAVELDLLSQFQKVCQKHGLIYYACAGTILGAVRHEGFIPWDDDIDVMMLRKDYDKLCEIASAEFACPYFFQTEKTDPGSIRGHAQLRNIKTTAILKEELREHYSFNQGIFIDIFPLDVFPDNAPKRQDFINNLRIYRHRSNQMARYTTRFHVVEGNTAKRRIRNRTGPFISWLFKHLHIRNYWYSRYESYSQKYNSMSCHDLGITVLSLTSNRFIWPRTTIMDQVEIPYEFLSIIIPKEYDEILKITYGDWKKPVKASSGHGGILFDVNKSFAEYLLNNNIKE